jgi:protein-L-isoaspartate(D-aspartate) O-methyltransferase
MRLISINQMVISLSTAALCWLCFAELACGGEGKPKMEQNRDSFYYQRQEMLDRQLARRDIRGKVMRHEFVPAQYRSQSYTDGPLSIGHGQTISQPYIVALMTQLAQVDSNSVVLEVGTGSGYQAAILAEIVNRVYSIEIVESLCMLADSTLKRLGYANISVKCGDGYRGWPEHAPFDAILVTAAPDHIPQPLIDQLKVDGHLIIPVGENDQDLLDITKAASGVIKKSVIPVRFVPMTGEALEK